MKKNKNVENDMKNDINQKSDLKGMKLEGLIQVASIIGADSLEEAIYYVGNDGGMQELLRQMMDKSMQNPNHVKKAELLFELETLGMSEEELEEMDEISRIRKLGYTGTSIEDLSEQFGKPIDSIKKIFEKNVELDMHIVVKKQLDEEDEIELFVELDNGMSFRMTGISQADYEKGVAGKQQKEEGKGYKESEIGKGNNSIDKKKDEK